MNRIIFLDIDGVLNHHPTIGELQDKLKTLWVLDYDNVNALNRLVKESGANIVISSSWRHQFSSRMHELKEIFEQFGFKHNDSIIDCTPRWLSRSDIIEQATNGIGLKHSMTIPRAWEILEWLAVQEEINRKVASFVVLDDDNPAYGTYGSSHPKAQYVHSRWVKTSMLEDGLTMDHVEKALKML